MPNSIARYEETPNPNALKCILARPLDDAGDDPLPFRTAAAASGHQLAVRLFAVPGVTNLLLARQWLTVNKDPDVSWKQVKKGVEQALAGDD